MKLWLAIISLVLLFGCASQPTNKIGWVNCCRTNMLGIKTCTSMEPGQCLKDGGTPVADCSYCK